MQTNNLEIIRGLNFDVHISKHFFDSDSLEKMEQKERQMRLYTGLFFRRPIFRQVLQEQSFNMVNQKIIVLRAHGTERKGSQKYWFNDGYRKCLVQDWIDEHDGKAAALVVMACNPLNSSISSTHSLIIHPTQNINLLDLWRTNPLRIFVPRYGYFDGNYYRLKKALRELRC
jgi:hypothetical protein